MKVGVLGCGHIATKMAEAMRATNGVECYAAASRSKEKAERFAKEQGFAKAYGTYEELAEDPEIDLIYIATPHSHHYQHGMICIEQGRNVLIEKAFTITAEQTRALIAKAREKDVFVCEAIWTRFMPARRIINDIIASGEIGVVRSITANLGYMLEGKERLESPALGGGAMLDLGVYPINFAMMHAGADVRSIKAIGALSQQKIDKAETIHIEFENGVIATLHATMMSATDRRGVIYGSRGYIEVENINNPESIKVYDEEHRMINNCVIPKQINGYEYELIASMKAMQRGEKETREMPLSETIKVMELMEKCLRDMGVAHNS